MVKLVVLPPVEEVTGTEEDTIIDIMEESNWGDKPGERPLLVIKCPVCGSTYTSITSIKSVGGYESESQGWIGKGTASVLQFDCEQGHYFGVLFGFHKGETFVQLKRVYKEGFIVKQLIEEEEEQCKCL